jgi:hypothetical protein
VRFWELQRDAINNKSQREPATMKEHIPRTTILSLSYVITAFVVCLTLSMAHSGLVNAQQQNNNTLMQSQGRPSITTTTTTNATNMNIS